MDTYEEILARMLGRVEQGDGTIDVREGSVIYSALAPAALEIVNAYMALENICNDAFADTAGRKCLILRAAERGLQPFNATKAELSGVFDKEVGIGEQFSGGGLIFTVTKKDSPLHYTLVCESEGIAGNIFPLNLVPLNFIEGLTSATLTALVTPGTEKEETEHFRKRYFDSLSTQAFSGNIADYKEKVNKLVGVSGVKVYPTWNGGGTVKLVVIGSDFHAPSATTLKRLQEEIDPLDSKGAGRGFAPIGHVVTVEAVTEVTVNVSVTLALQGDFTEADVKKAVDVTIQNYFLELNKTFAECQNLIVRISKIESFVLGVSGILDVTATKLNGGTTNIILGENEIVRFGTVSLTII